MATVRLATLNLRKGELRWGERAPLVFEQTARLQPDIIGFQEIDVRLDQGNYICRRVNDLSWSQEGWREYRIHHMAYPRESLALEALGIMTNLPVISHTGFDYLIRNRVAHCIRVDVDGRPLDFWNTHFHHVQDDAGFKMRRDQAEKLAGWIATHSAGVPAVLVGDLNCIPASEPARTLAEKLESVFDCIGIEAPRTVPTPLDKDFPYPGSWAIDHIFVSRDIRVLSAGLTFDAAHADDPTLVASDHFGLTATIEIA
jgi:endonuclease/exonuclease/phosphatase family metal-dependent hydrolase